ncbi:hypothetical protein FPV67DRAFT_1460822 [Lyophyllum atratum]|nr:hypothetical protein FPV67DRAFT_1460822 [Lyophyllum atratum]
MYDERLVTPSSSVQRAANRSVASVPLHPNGRHAPIIPIGLAREVGRFSTQLAVGYGPVEGVSLRKRKQEEGRAGAYLPPRILRQRGNRLRFVIPVARFYPMIPHRQVEVATRISTRNPKAMSPATEGPQQEAVRAGCEFPDYSFKAPPGIDVTIPFPRHSWCLQTWPVLCYIYHLRSRGVAFHPLCTHACASPNTYSVAAMKQQSPPYPLRRRKELHHSPTCEYRHNDVAGKESFDRLATTATVVNGQQAACQFIAILPNPPKGECAGTISIWISHRLWGWRIGYTPGCRLRWFGRGLMPNNGNEAAAGQGNASRRQLRRLHTKYGTLAVPVCAWYNEDGHLYREPGAKITSSNTLAAGDRRNWLLGSTLLPYSLTA